jgi:sugar phosphate isomerase/epimerase
VRLADCRRNGYEEHLVPGQGDFDFGAMFALLEGRGYRGAYTNAFGTLEDMQSARAWLVDKARGAGVAVG